MGEAAGSVLVFALDEDFRVALDGCVRLSVRHSSSETSLPRVPNHVLRFLRSKDIVLVSATIDTAPVSTEVHSEVDCGAR